ncbi:ROK family protein [Humidisolicoccus flavus]|uniref:ROK family protein n=1 Tax=Humidisolicoccus flavus TaxID=3111414 RepID=UPI0032448004
MQKVAVDIGGTSVKLARVTPDGLRDLHRIPTPQGDADGSATAAAIAAAVRAMLGTAGSTSLGLVAPGIVDHETQTVVRSVNLGWNDVAIAALLRAHLDCDIRFGHDVGAAALAEALVVRGETQQTISFLPIGTGFSVATVMPDGSLAERGWAGEIGHLRSVLPSRAGTSGQSGIGESLESLASAAGIARRLGVRNAAAAAELVRSGDSRAAEIWQHAVEVIADVVTWVTALRAPDAIVIGGGLALSGPLLFDPLQTAIDERLGDVPRVPVVAAQLGDLAALHGAARLADAAYVPHPREIA